MGCVCDGVMVVRAGLRSVALESVTVWAIGIEFAVVWTVATVGAIIGRHRFG